MFSSQKQQVFLNNIIKLIIYRFIVLIAWMQNYIKKKRPKGNK